MKYGFFTPQPIKAAPIYYIRRCLHDWPDEVCVRILKDIAASMDPAKSRLLIAEMYLPDQGANIEAAWFNMTMMTPSGRERTKSDWT